MQQVKVYAYGGPEQLCLEEGEMPEPGQGEVCVRLTSIGMNHAELMGRRGEYKASTGEPPFVPGIEGGGVVHAVGEGVDPARVGQRVCLGPNVPRGITGLGGGTYRSHMVVPENVLVIAPDALPDDQLGAVWLPYFTAWGCLVWKHGVKPGDYVGITAASSSVALAAAQIVKHYGGIPIGLTSSPEKVEAIQTLPNCDFAHLVVTHEVGAEGERVLRPWHRDIKRITDGHGVDVFFDSVASGPYLGTEVRALANRGVVYMYGLLGDPGVVDLSPLIIRMGRIDTWMLYEMVAAGEDVWRPACEQILALFDQGVFRQHVSARFKLSEVQAAHEQMERGRHIGKWVLIP